MAPEDATPLREGSPTQETSSSLPLTPLPSQCDCGRISSVLFDIDGTLAIVTDRSPYDTAKCAQDQPNAPVIEVARFYKQAGYELILLSGRSEEFVKETQDWLARYEVPYDLLLMRRVGDTRKDVLIKRELYECSIQPFYTVRCVYDDRKSVCDLWRNVFGLTVFQVAEGDF